MPILALAQTPDADAKHLKQLSYIFRKRPESFLVRFVGAVVDITVASGDREGSDCTQEYGIKEIKQSPMYSIAPSVARATAFEWQNG